jgi:hypothetical protein
MEQLVSRWTDFREIWGFLLNSAKNIQVSLILDKKHALYLKTYDNVSLISSWVEKVSQNIYRKLYRLPGNCKKVRQRHTAHKYSS